MEGEVEKFVGQPVTPPSTPHKGEMMSPPRQQSTPPIASNVPPTSNPPHTIYSPMVNQVVIFAFIFFFHIYYIDGMMTGS